jgi:hypothetical protein
MSDSTGAAAAVFTTLREQANGKHFSLSRRHKIAPLAFFTRERIAYGCHNFWPSVVLFLGCVHGVVGEMEA